MLPTPQRSDYFLVVVRPEAVGRLDLTQRTWKSEDSLLISFSEWHEWQEAMLLMPPYAWLRSDLGMFFLEPLADRPWATQLRLGLSAGNRICDTLRVPSN
jgi:hypothetical protein